MEGLRYNLGAVNRACHRALVKRMFGLLRSVGAASLAGEGDVLESDVVWREPDTEEVMLEPPVCNRSFPEAVAGRPGRYRLVPNFVVERRDIRLLPPVGVPWDGENAILGYALLPGHYSHPFAHLPVPALLRGAMTRSGRGYEEIEYGCTLVSAWSRTYYHWLVEFLPRISILEHSGIAARHPGLKYIIDPEPRRWQLESLKAMGIPDDALVRMDKPLRVRNLVIPTFPRRPVMESRWSIVSPRYLRQCRDRLYAHCGVDLRKEPSLRVCLSRRHVVGRRILNEDQLSEALRGLGFQICAPEDLSFEDEVRLFASARIVIGPTGSGLANSMLCRSPVDMIEIGADERGARYPDSMAYSQASSLGQRFGIYLADAVPRLIPTRFDIRVDVDDFVKFLRTRMAIE